MLKQTSSLTVREELVAVKGALELGFLSVQTLAPHWEKFYSTLARGNAGLLALLIEQGCLSESQVEFLKEGVEEDRQSHQLPQSVDIRNRKSVEKFLGTAERSSEPAQTASTARTKTGPQKAVVSKGTQQETVGQAAKKPAAVGQAAQSSGQAKKSAAVGQAAQSSSQAKKSAASLGPDDTVSIACPHCKFRYRIRKELKVNKSNKFEEIAVAVRRNG